MIGNNTYHSIISLTSISCKLDGSCLNDFPNGKAVVVYSHHSVWNLKYIFFQMPLLTELLVNEVLIKSVAGFRSSVCVGTIQV